MQFSWQIRPVAQCCLLRYGLDVRVTRAESILYCKFNIENGFDYLVFGQGMYQRFYREPEKYSVEVAQYDSFFNRFTLLKAFTDGDYEVRVYAIQ